MRTILIFVASIGATGWVRFGTRLGSFGGAPGGEPSDGLATERSSISEESRRSIGFCSEAAGWLRPARSRWGSFGAGGSDDAPPLRPRSSAPSIPSRSPLFSTGSPATGKWADENPPSSTIVATAGVVLRILRARSPETAGGLQGRGIVATLASFATPELTLPTSSPLVGEGRGGGWNHRGHGDLQLTPHPNPPPQGGRELSTWARTECDTPQGRSFTREGEEGAPLV